MDQERSLFWTLGRLSLVRLVRAEKHLLGTEDIYEDVLSRC